MHLMRQPIQVSVHFNDHTVAKFTSCTIVFLHGHLVIYIHFGLFTPNIIVVVFNGNLFLNFFIFIFQLIICAPSHCKLNLELVVITHKYRSTMKFLTTNFVKCAVKGCQSSLDSFPLKYEECELVQEEQDYNPEFIVHMLDRLD